jgi:predicted DNA-binding transcriptional regulator AlpA
MNHDRVTPSAPAPITTPSVPLLVPKSEVERLTGLSQRTIDRLVSAGKFLKPTRLGGRVLWNRERLSEWVHNGCPPVEEQRS